MRIPSRLLLPLPLSVVATTTASSVDVTNSEQCAQAVRTAVQLGHINVLVNNAGISQPHSLEEFSNEDYDKIMDIHVHAGFRLCKLVLPHLRASCCGAIVNLSSINAVRGGGILRVLEDVRRVHDWQLSGPIG